MNEVFVLQHVYESQDGSEDVKMIGIYGTRANAMAAVERLGSQPGFRDHPKGFSIDKYELDKDHWTEGFGLP